VKIILKLIALAFVFTNIAEAQEQIRMVGSSTVLPFARVAAEQFGKSTPHKTPIVESGGSGGGLKLFCEGSGNVDIANSSRQIKPKETQACAANGVTDIAEIIIGYDGIVFISSIDSASYELTIPQIYLALAKEVPVDGKMVDNPYKNWRQIDPALPDAMIKFFIPGEKHGTRDVFDSKVMYGGCKAIPAVATLTGLEGNSKALKNECRKVRTDGVSNDIDGDYSITLLRTQKAKDSIGVLGFGFYDLNQDKVQAAAINGKRPTLDDIAEGNWPIARPLYIYVNRLSKTKGLNEYVRFFLSQDMIGDEGLAVEKGLIPQAESQRKKTLKEFTDS